MTGVVFKNTLQRSWRGMIYWAIGVAFLGVYSLVVIPNVDMLKQYADLIGNMPPALMQMFGVSDAASMATPAGFLGFAFFGYTLLILAAYAVVAGLNITANEEDRGILDLVLSLPIPRWRLMVERLLAYTLMLVAILTLTFVPMWLIMSSNDVMGIDPTRLLEGVINMLPSTLLVLAVTALAGTALRTRGRAAALATGFVIVSYFINFIGSAASDTAAASLRVVSFFTYYNGGEIMNTGLVWGNVGLLVVVTAICTAAALWFFERRDISV